MYACFLVFSCSPKGYQVSRPATLVQGRRWKEVLFERKKDVWEEQGGLRGTRGSGSIKGTWATCEYVWHISGLPFYHRAGQEQFQTIIWCAILHLQLQRLHYSLHYFLWHISGLPIHTVEIVLSSCEFERRALVLDRGIQWLAEVLTQLLYHQNNPYTTHCEV